jgi:hypothetical protein
LISVCFLGGSVLLILSRRFKKDPGDVIKRIRAGNGMPQGLQVAAQPVVADTVDEETH